MKIAIKFDKNGNLVSYCTDLSVSYLEQITPSSEGFEFYKTELDISDIAYFKLVNGAIVLDTEMKEVAELRQTSHKEMQSIQNWFNDYDRKVSEHSRCARLNTPCHHDIATLDAEAVIRAARLSALKTEARS